MLTDHRYAAVAAALLYACSALGGAAVARPATPPHDLARDPLPTARLADPGTFIVYGDSRFTDPRETVAGNPRARAALVRQVAAEHPSALVLTGDIPWHGGDPDDYRVYAAETGEWRAQGLPVLPVLGNHELSDCAETNCLENWWNAFPMLRGRRWYRTDFGPHVRFIALDSNSPLTVGSAQRAWLDHEFDTLPAPIRFVVVGLHHPPVADDGWLIVRDNERSLRSLFETRATRLAARLIVCAGHVHNYERFQHAGVTYLVSGGGGARPLRVRRTAADLYRDAPFPNYHYLRFDLHGDTLTVSMVRLEDADSARPGEWRVRDRFDITAR